MKKPGKRENQSELSGTLGINRANLIAHLKKAGAPRRDRRGKYNVEAVRGFILSERAAGNSQSPELLQLRCEKLQLEIQALRRELDLKENAVPLEQLTGWLSQFMEQIKISLPSQFRASLVLQLEGKDRLDMLRVLENYTNETLQHLAGWLKHHNIVINIGDLKYENQAPFQTLCWWSDQVDHSALPGTITRDDLSQMVMQLRAGLRSAGVTDEQLQRATQRRTPGREGNRKT